MIETKPFLLSEAVQGVRPAIPGSDWAVWFGVLAAFIVVLFVVIAPPLAWLLIYFDAPASVIGMLPAILIVAASPLWGLFLRRWQKRINSRNPTLTSLTHAVFDEKGARFRSEVMDFYVTWPGIFSFREDAKSIVFYLGPCGAYAVPKAQLGTDETAQAEAVIQIRAWMRESGAKVQGAA